MEIRARVTTAVRALEETLLGMSLSDEARDALVLLYALAVTPGIFICPLCDGWAVRASNRQRICPRCRRSHPHQTVEYLRARSTRPPRPLKPRICPLCDDPFQQKAGNQVLCSRCRALHGNRSVADLLARRTKRGHMPEQVVTTSQILEAEADEAKVEKPVQRQGNGRIRVVPDTKREAEPRRTPIPLAPVAPQPTGFLLANDVRPVDTNGRKPVSSWWARAAREGFSLVAERERERMQRSKEVRQVTDRIIGESSRSW